MSILRGKKYLLETLKKSGGAVMRLVSIYDQEKLKEHGLLVKPETLRIWRCKGKFVKDGLFVKLGHRLLIDLDALERILNPCSTLHANMACIPY